MLLFRLTTRPTCHHNYFYMCPQMYLFITLPVNSYSFPVFHDMAASFDSDEDWGPPVSDRLAELLERCFGSKLPDRKVKEKLTAHQIPANCRKSMGVPKTNQEVFSAIPPFARKADVRMRNTQLSLTKAAVAITCCTDQLLKLHNSLSTLDVTKPMPDTTVQLKQKTTECIANLALALTGHACKDLSQKRRDMHRPHLPPRKCGNLCTARSHAIGVALPQGQWVPQEPKRGAGDSQTGPGHEGSGQQKRARPVAPRKFKHWRFFRPPTLEAGRQLQQQETLDPGQEGCRSPRGQQSQTLGMPAFPSGHENQVSDIENYIPALKTYLWAKHERFQAGQIKTKLNNWKRMTSDPEVLETVKGLKIKFDGNPMMCSQKEQRYFSENENHAVDEETEKLLKKKVIQKSCQETGQVVSPIFVREKKDGSHRMILNLKDLNQQVEYQKF